MILNHSEYKIMNVIGYGTIMIKISVELIWNDSWKVFMTGKMFEADILSAITGQRVIFLVLPCFYNWVLHRLKLSLCSRPTPARSAFWSLVGVKTKLWKDWLIWSQICGAILKTTWHCISWYQKKQVLKLQNFGFVA